MVQIFHNHYKITRILYDEYDFNYLKGQSVLEGISELIKVVPEASVLWCNEDYVSYLNLTVIHNLFLTSTTLYSFNPNENDFFNRVIGYVDLSSAISISYKKTYPTWLMSSEVGVASLQLFKLALELVPVNSDFDYFLKSFAKLSQVEGVFCYSEPSLLLGYKNDNKDSSSIEIAKLVRFTKQHYKLGWTFQLLYSFLFYEKIYAFFSMISPLFYKRRGLQSKVIINDLSASTLLDVTQLKIDVLIPTIGRETYLYDVLCDLKNQTVLPKKVIIIEQNPDTSCSSSLDYLKNEKWPFEIVHNFTHQTGVCNARNIGLDAVTNEWIFFADDDIRLVSNFIEQALQKMTALNSLAASFNCVPSLINLTNENNPFQWGSFGSGSSIVNQAAIAGCRFGKGYEFGFGEDADFGMQIRKNGYDVLFFEYPNIVHLKAPIGGFRTKPVVEWANETYAPKPSPTVMLFRLKNCTVAQNRTYKLKLFLSYYKSQSIKNPIAYYTTFKKQWQVSQKWAHILSKKNEL